MAMSPIEETTPYAEVHIGDQEWKIYRMSDPANGFNFKVAARFPMEARRITYTEYWSLEQGNAFICFALELEGYQKRQGFASVALFDPEALALSAQRHKKEFEHQALIWLLVTGLVAALIKIFAEAL